MCDFDDFEDDYYDFKDEDSFEDEYDVDAEMDESFDCESEHDGEPDEAESQDDDFTAKDAFIIGGAMGFAYEESLNEGKRRKREI